MELVQGCAVSAASVAAVIDVWSRRIPNWVTFGTFFAGVAVNVWLHGFAGLASALVGTVVGMAMLLPFYAIGAIGAGDVKLLGALGALLGPQLLVTVAIYGAIAGGALSLVILALRGRLFVAVADLVLHHRPPTLSGATAP